MHCYYCFAKYSLYLSLISLTYIHRYLHTYSHITPISTVTTITLILNTSHIAPTYIIVSTTNHWIPYGSITPLTSEDILGI